MSALQLAEAVLGPLAGLTIDDGVVRGAEQDPVLVGIALFRGERPVPGRRRPFADDVRLFADYRLGIGSRRVLGQEPVAYGATVRRLTPEPLSVGWTDRHAPHGGGQSGA